jgi:hypothetical protein
LFLGVRCEVTQIRASGGTKSQFWFEIVRILPKTVEISPEEAGFLLNFEKKVLT